MRLAERAGLRNLADRWLSVPTGTGENAGKKVSSLVGGMVAGADSNRATLPIDSRRERARRKVTRHRRGSFAAAPTMNLDAVTFALSTHRDRALSAARCTTHHDENMTVDLSA